ncbi:MAG: iron-sulfur cluster assembly accessory protein [Cyanobacteria bacterium]|nr:iron-sulfur cluster assembly accessory protein [Cyanobacteriota bacterium]MDW8202772.1 iron-sulfur cluster assembly accessory protein [Cyanobacteriota bacterium SKYGB_h_bin112]
MIHLSETAVSELLRLRSRSLASAANLRLGVRPGGCAGLVYSLTFDDRVATDDQIFDGDRLPVVINRQDLEYLRGLTIDYSEDLMGGAFQFRNPQATSTCSCGTSFAVSS